MLSQTVLYAIRIVSALADSLEAGRYHNPLVICAATGEAGAAVPVQYAAKILQTLSASGVVVGKRGPGGGNMLQRIPTNGEMLEIFGCGLGDSPIETALGGVLGEWLNLPVNQLADYAELLADADPTPAPAQTEPKQRRRAATRK